MRWMSVVIIGTICYLLGLAWYDSNQLSSAYQKASLSLNTDVKIAISQMAATSKLGDIESLGKASRTRKRFVGDLIDTCKQLVGRPAFSYNDSENLIAGLNELKTTPALSASEQNEARAAIMSKSRESVAQMASVGMLPDFDLWRTTMKRIETEGLLEGDALVSLREAIAEAEKTDRFPTAQRTTVTTANNLILRGLSSLNIHPSAPDAPAMPAAGAGLDGWSPGPAEADFNEAAAAIDAFLAQWKPESLPEDMRRIKAAALHNSAMLRAAYSLETQARNKEWGMYFLPNFQPSGAAVEELRASYLQGMNSFFEQALSAAEAMPESDKLRPLIRSSALYHRALVRARIGGDSAGAATDWKQFLALNPGSPAAAQGPSDAKPMIMFFR